MKSKQAEEYLIDKTVEIDGKYYKFGRAGELLQTTDQPPIEDRYIIDDIDGLARISSRYGNMPTFLMGIAIRLEDGRTIFLRKT